MYEKEEPMHDADEFLCRDSDVLKCEAVALVGHRSLQPKMNILPVISDAKPKTTKCPIEKPVFWIV